MVLLYQSSKSNISEHIKHIISEGELDENSTVRKFRIVQKEGDREDVRIINHYDLDMIIVIGYKGIKNLLFEEKAVLSADSVVRNFRITASDSKIYNVKHYNLDMIIATCFYCSSPCFIFTHLTSLANKTLKSNGYCKNIKNGKIKNPKNIFHFFAFLYSSCPAIYTRK